jgi:hypothetical protein
MDKLAFHVGFDGFATHGTSHILPVGVFGTVPFAYTPIVKLVSALGRGDERLHVPRTNGAIGVIFVHIYYPSLLVFGGDNSKFTKNQ